MYEEGGPKTLDEIRGMAEGAGVEFHSLFGLNAAQELAYSELFKPRRERRHDSRRLNDSGPQRGRFHLLLGPLLRYGGDAFLAFAYACMVLHQGFNDRGIGPVGNAIYSSDLKVGVPKLIAYKEIIRRVFYPITIETDMSELG